MENQTNSNQDCNCSSDCCQPAKKQNLWMKLLFVIIILAAGTIVTIKLTGKDTSEITTTSDTSLTKQTTNCDTTSIPTCGKVCDPSKKASCCPQSKE